MINAKEEFLREIDGKDVKCVYINYNAYKYIYPDKDQIIYLKVGYTQENYQEFLSKLDFEYDDGFGTQELEGYIWYHSGDWSERHEYDGAENWVFKTPPSIPNILL